MDHPDRPPVHHRNPPGIRFSRWHLVGAAAAPDGSLFHIGGVQSLLRCVDDAAELPLVEGMAREADRVTDLLDSPDGQEGLAAFVAKRPASFAPG